MQFRVTKVRAEELGPQHNGKLLNVTWLIEVWQNAVPLTDPTIISQEVQHEYFKHDDPEELNNQDVRINTYLENRAFELVDTYLNERALITTEPRIDTAVTTLQAVLEAEYGAQ